jgi:hypothetical protein
MVMMRKQKQRLYIYKIVAFATTAVLVVSGVAFINYQRLERQAARIPATIRNDLTFSPFIITLDNDNYKALDYKLAEVEKGVQLLSFVVTFEDKRITISEYVQPPQFTEIPEFKQRFLDNAIKQKGTVQTANGTLYLGEQVKQDGKQLAIMLERGLIVMFNPETELSPAEWRRLGDQFDIQKISD